jgi:hypothetical protein
VKKYKQKIGSCLYRINKLNKTFLFPFTYGRKLSKYKNIYLNDRCFIIGNGPSLRPEDLTKLKHEITFAFNRIYYIFDQTDWRPTFYLSEDDKTILKSEEEISSLQIKNKFFPVNIPWDYKIYFNNANYYLFKMGDEKSEPNFSEDIVKGIYWGNTVVYSAIQMAVYMGIKEIYLLGVDHNFSKMINDNGEIVINNDAKDYFIDRYNIDKEDLYLPNVDISTRAFIAAKKYLDKHNVNIYNATRGGKLEVFERVEFDQLIF